MTTPASPFDQIAVEAAERCAALIPMSFGVRAFDFQPIIQSVIEKATEPLADAIRNLRSIPDGLDNAKAVLVAHESRAAHPIEPTDQVAAEAAEKIDSEQQTGTLGVPSLSKIILAAIEKSTAEAVGAYKAEVKSHQRTFDLMKHYRAAHASEQPPVTDDKQADEIRRRTGCKGGAMAEGAHLEAAPRGEHEWTREYVLAIARQHIGADAISDAVSDAHNAALAAERQRTESFKNVGLGLERQLAAEREKHEAEIRQLTTDNWRYCEEQRQQLAAERQKYDRSQERVRKWFDLLAAERENPHNWTEDREPWRNSGNIVMFHDSQAIALAATENDAKLLKTAHNTAFERRVKDAETD